MLLGDSVLRIAPVFQQLARIIHRIARIARIAPSYVRKCADDRQLLFAVASVLIAGALMPLGSHMKKQAVPIGQLASLVARVGRLYLSVRHHPLPPIEVDGSETGCTTSEPKTLQTSTSARFAEDNGSMPIEEWRKGCPAILELSPYNCAAL